MIPHFAAPYPEEVLFSTLVRTVRLLDWNSVDMVETAPIIKNNPHLPTKLREFQENLPPGHCLQEKNMFETRTLFPIYTFGESAEGTQALRKEMEEAGRPAGKANISNRKKQIWLKYCPECLKEQVNEYGEGYWKRVHQVGTVSACPTHGCRLRKNPWTRRWADFVTLPEDTAGTEPAADWETEHAQFCDAVLNGFTIQPRKLTRYFWHHLLLKKLAARLGDKHRILPKKIQEASQFISPEFWEETGIGADCHNFSNRIRMVVEQEANSYQGILLLRCILGLQPCDFEKAINSPATVFPCRNPLAACLKKETIRGVRQGSLNRWAFLCPDCGFEYTLPAKQVYRNTPKDDPAIRITKTGEIWQEKLRGMWDDKTLSNRKLAKICGINILRLNTEGTRMGLTGRSRMPVYAISDHSRENQGKKTEDHKKSWLAALEKDKEMGRSAFFAKYARHGRWLKRYDLVWINSHLPQKLALRTRSPKDRAKAIAILERVSSGLRPPEGNDPRREKRDILERTTAKEQKFLEWMLGDTAVARALRSQTESLKRFWDRRIHWVAKTHPDADYKEICKMMGCRGIPASKMGIIQSLFPKTKESTDRNRT